MVTFKSAPAVEVLKRNEMGVAPSPPDVGRLRQQVPVFRAGAGGLDGLLEGRSGLLSAALAFEDEHQELVVEFDVAAASRRERDQERHRGDQERAAGADAHLP